MIIYIYIYVHSYLRQSQLTIIDVLCGENMWKPRTRKSSALTLLQMCKWSGRNRVRMKSCIFILYLCPKHVNRMKGKLQIIIEFCPASAPSVAFVSCWHTYEESSKTANVTCSNPQKGRTVKSCKIPQKIVMNDYSILGGYHEPISFVPYGWLVQRPEAPNSLQDWWPEYRQGSHSSISSIFLKILENDPKLTYIYII